MKADRYKHIALLFILIIVQMGLVKAQDKTQSINLETVLQIGGANNLTIQEYKLRQALALAKHTKAKEWWLPDVYFGTSVHQLWGSAMNGDGRFFTEVNRQNFWTGFGLNASWNFGDAIFKEDAAELKTQAAVYTTEVEKNKALVEVVQTYYDFLTAQLHYNAYEALSLEADTIARQIEIQVQAGIRYTSDALLAKSNYNHLRVEMLKAKTRYNNKSASLVRILNLDPNVKLVGMDSVLIPIELVSSESLRTPLESAYTSRPELQSMDLTLQSIHIEKKTTTTGLWLPELRVGTYGSYFGDVIQPLNPTSEVNVSLLWKIPLGRAVYGGDLKRFEMRIQLQENKISQTKSVVNEEVISSKLQITTAKEQLEIAKEGSELSGLALQQSMQRQQLGTVRPFEILQAQEIYIQSRLDYLNAVASFNKAQYAYYVAIGNNL
ncbi:MAG: outer membrane protein TolC [Bacteroidia bacterium]|jgi:outer membrane protein TolC